MGVTGRRGLLALPLLIQFALISVNMIDISQWRVAIGLWNCCRVLICCSSTLKGGCTLSNCLILSISLVVLITFLIILSGDVELNPGPPKCEHIIH